MPDNFSQPKFLETNRGRLAYFFNNEFPGRPTLVCLHGLSSNHTTWNLLTRVIREHQVNVLAPDQRGHGYSDKSKERDRYNFSVFSDDLRQILAKENLSKVALVGYSYGGYIALDYINKYPENISSLILISTNHVNPFKYWHINFLTWPAYGLLNFAAWVFLWQKRKQYHYFNYEEARNYWQSTLVGFITMPFSVNVWMLAEVAHLNFSQAIAKIICPTLLIKSKNDPFVSQKEVNDMLQKIKFARSTVLEEETHFIGTRLQEKIAENIIDFLKEEKNI